MATTDSIINGLLQREGGYVNDPADNGGRTIDGISEKANPDLWANGTPTPAQIRQRYIDRYVKGPGFDQIADTQLQAQLVDFGVNSGPAVAITKLQGILHVAQDGVLGPETLAAITTLHPEDICNSLVAARVRMIGQIVSKNPSQIKFLNGWLDRALQFLV